jgi:hypothetical protein
MTSAEKTDFSWTQTYPKRNDISRKSYFNGTQISSAERNNINGKDPIQRGTNNIGGMEMIP